MVITLASQSQIFVGIIYEICVLVISILILVLVGQRYREKRNQPTLFLFLIFINYSITVAFSIISKIISYVYYQPGGDPNPDIPGLLLWYFLEWILDFRFSEVFVVLAVYCSYVFIVKIFQSGYNQRVRALTLILATFAMAIALIATNPFDQLIRKNYNVLSFLLTFVFMCGIYIPFGIYAINAYRKSQDRKNKNAFLSLTVMAIAFALVFFWFMMDQLWTALYKQQYTIFYFLAWACGVISLVTAYLGFIRPRSRQIGEQGGESAKSE